MAATATRPPTQAEKDKWDLALHYHNPATDQLPPGLQADSTYLAFLRGLGVDYTTAQAAALQNIAAARAAYAGNVETEPLRRQQEIRGVNDALGDRGLWFSGERLTKVAEQRTASQERLAQYAAAQADAIRAARQGLASTIAQENMQRAEQVGGLQQRTDQRHNTDAYNRALANLAGGGGGGGGGFSYGGGTLPGTGAAPTPAPHAAAAPARPPSPSNPYAGFASNNDLRNYFLAVGNTAAAAAVPVPNNPFPSVHPNMDRAASFNSLNPQQQMEFAGFLHQNSQANISDPTQLLKWWLGGGNVPLSYQAPNQGPGVQHGSGRAY